MRDGWRWIGTLWGSYASSLEETIIEELLPCCCCWQWLSFCLDSARGIVTTIEEYNKHHPNLHCWKRWNRSGALDPEPVDIDR